MTRSFARGRICSDYRVRPPTKQYLRIKLGRSTCFRFLAAAWLPGLVGGSTQRGPT